MGVLKTLTCLQQAIQDPQSKDGGMFNACRTLTGSSPF